ncbi:MAG: ORF6N domain-containing protein [Chitinophagaceae bacterium]|nr:ORF6N domain-containing protein [Chitinophagaceae bacterium]
MQIIQSIQNRICELRDERVMLDFDLAQLYEVETKALNQAVKRNSNRFPFDFMFRLTLAEWQTIRSQSVTASQSKRNTSVTPYAFTEQGAAKELGLEWQFIGILK